MTRDGHSILRDALDLPADERAEVIVELIASLDGSPDPDAEQAWAREIEQRARRARDGTTAGTDWKVVRDRFQDRLDQR
jgi:hypothetical protein